MSSQPPTIFISYAREDAAHKERLIVHLQGLIQRGVIETWHDGLLVPGQQWNAEIVRNLEASRLVLLLISADFIASEYATRVELRRAAEQRAQGRLCVVPVLVEHVHGWGDKPLGDIKLGDLQALPEDGRFVTQWGNDNAAWANVVKGIEAALAACVRREDEGKGALTPDARGEREDEDEDEDEDGPTDDWRVRIPAEPHHGVLRRRDREGRDIVSHLVEELAPGRNRLVMLSGPGGVGKTTLAAEAARRLRGAYGGRVVWSYAEGRVNYTESSLFEDIAIKLGRPRPHRFPFDRKRDDAHALIAGRPLLVVVDSYEVVRPGARRRIQRWLEGTPCSALFVSREMDARLDMHSVRVGPMFHDEAREMLGLLVKEAQSPKVFDRVVCDCALAAACGIPLALKLIVAQLNLRRRPDGVFEELRRGQGEAADRAFNYSFNLRRVGGSGRAVLLALSLFRPSATHEALAYVAGFGRGPRALRRLDRVVANLTRLSLLSAGEPSGRLGLEDLTRRIARAKLNEDNRAGRFGPLPGFIRPLFLWFLTEEGRARHFKRRFVEYFREHAASFRWEDYAEQPIPEAERSNVVAAMQFACERQDWDTVLELFAVTLTYINTYPVWKRSVVAAEREVGNRLLKTGRRPPLLIEINHRRENKRASRGYYEGIPEKLGVPGIATHADLIGLGPSLLNLPREEWWKLVVLSVVAFELGVCAHSRGKHPLARGYFEAAKILKGAFGDYGGYGIACNGLGVTLAVEGLAGKGEEGWEAKALAAFDEAKTHFTQQREKAEGEQRWEDGEKFAKFEKVSERNMEWLDGLKDQAPPHTPRLTQTMESRQPGQNHPR